MTPCDSLREGSAWIYGESEVYPTGIRHTGNGPPSPVPRTSLHPRSLSLCFCPVRKFYFFPGYFLGLVSKLPFRTMMVYEDTLRYLPCQELSEQRWAVFLLNTYSQRPLCGLVTGHSMSPNFTLSSAAFAVNNKAKCCLSRGPRPVCRYRI